MLLPALLLIVGLSAICLYKEVRTRHKLPPGPIIRLPLLGHLPMLGSNPAKTLLRWSKYYGPIIYVQMGSFPTVVINDYSLIRKAFKLPSLAGSASIKLLDKGTGNRKSFVFSDGPKAMEQRRFTIRTLKSFGYGSQSMENRILDHVPSILEVFKDHLIKPLSVRHAFQHSVFNTLWDMVTGQSFGKNDKTLQQMSQNVYRFVQMETIVDKLAVFVNCVPDMLPEVSGFNEKIRGMQQNYSYLERVLQEHKQTRIEDQPRDLVDAYLDQVERTTDPESSFYAPHGCILYTLNDLLMGGVETTTTTLEWLLYYMAKYPHLQERLQKEIDDSLESNKLPCSQDQERMPYAKAVISELLRIVTTIPFPLHCAMEDTVLGKYTIPKGTTVVPNIYAVHHNEDIWGDPESFRPERFLENEEFKNISEFIPFGLGRRTCIGESLARLQLFLFTVCIFQKYSVKAVSPLPNEDGNYGIARSVKPFQVEVSRRLKKIQR